MQIFFTSFGLAIVTAACLWSGTAQAQAQFHKSERGIAATVDQNCADQDANRFDRNQVCKITNDRRYQYGRMNLILDPTLSRIAQRFAEDMNARGYFGHVTPEGQTMSMRLSQGNARFSSAGENIAKGQSSSSEVMQSWMGSPGHRANILKSDYRRIGIGHAGDVWVQEFTD